MKNSIFIAAVVALFAFSSCKKCKQCTRYWDAETYQITPSGNTFGYAKYENTRVEIFDVCGGGDITNAEKTVIDSSYTVLSNGNKVVTKLTGDCSCN